MASYQVVIIGGGPAGLTAGLYASRAGLRSLLLERGLYGGQIVNAQRVENYPGFPEGIAGLKLGELMYEQATRYGLETLSAEVTGMGAGSPYEVSTSEGAFEAQTVIIAAGAEPQKLGVPGEERLLGHGVSYCATCDGFFFREQDVAVIGGGDTALSDALELTQHARKVYVIHRRDQLRAGRVIQERAFAEPKLSFIWDTVVDEIAGNDLVSHLKLRNVKSGQASALEVSGIFVAVGIRPNSQRYAHIVKVDETGHIVTDERLATSAPGIFAAGDIRQNSARQVITAAGDGAAAALSAFKYLFSR